MKYRLHWGQKGQSFIFSAELLLWETPIAGISLAIAPNIILELHRNAILCPYGLTVSWQSQAVQCNGKQSLELEFGRRTRACHLSFLYHCILHLLEYCHH